MTDLQTRRTFLGALNAFSTATFLQHAAGTNSALGDERYGPERVAVSPEVVQKTIHAMCRILVPSEQGSITGEKAAPKVGSGVIIQTPEALADIVGPDRMVILTVAHNFMDTPRTADITLEFFNGSISGIAPTATISGRLLASDRHFNSSDDVAFLVIDLPKDPLLAQRFKARALKLEKSTTFPQFTPVCSAGFSAGKCLVLDDLRLLDTPKQSSGNAALLLTGSVKPGHSGSPLVNSDGLVIGIVSGTHEMPRSIAKGEPLDFIATWDPLSPTTGTRAEIERAIRDYDLQHVPHAIQFSKNRILGPSVQAVSNFASVVKERFADSHSKFEQLIASKRRLAAAVQSSDLPQDHKVELIGDLQRRLFEGAAEYFFNVGGTPRTIAEQIRTFGT